MRRMAAFEKWQRFKRIRNSCLMFAFSVGVLGLIGVTLGIPDPSLEKLTWGIKVGLCIYVIIFCIPLTLAVVYHYRMRRQVKSV